MIHLKKISINQLICLVILTQIGAHVVVMPYPESRHAGYDSWMSILIGGLFAQLTILVIYQLGKRYPDRPIQQYVSSIVGRPIGMLLNLLFAIYCAESALLVAVTYSDILSRWVLIETPWIVLVGLSILMAAYFASSSLRSISTLTQSIMGLFLICVVMIVISGLGKGDWDHFFPIGTHGIGAVLKDSIPSFWAYAGYELLLVVFPYVKTRKKKEIFIAMSVANGLTTCFYLLITVFAIYNFDEVQLNSITEPLVFILRKFRWPIVQSLDILFMAIWLAVTTVTVYVYLFLSARYLAHVGQKENQHHSVLVWIISIICFVFGIWGSDRQHVFRFGHYHNTATLVMVTGMPTVLLLISTLRGKGARG